jgi:chemotaxis protein methyltransferase CheR
MIDRKPLSGIEDGRALAQAIVDTVREPLLVLDQDLHVVAASRSFYLTFGVSPQQTLGYLLFHLGDGQWDIPGLRLLLEKIIPEHGVMDAYEVEHDFPGIGYRTMLLNARQVFSEGKSPTLLLAIEDVTKTGAAERELKELLEQKEILLQEMQHRVANSLQIIASILLIKAKTVHSEETRKHLQDAHKRVMSVATIQDHLHATGRADAIEITPYLTKLCETLAASMIGESRPISLQVHGGFAAASSKHAISLGLIVTELVINALKHAFPDDKQGGEIVVTYDVVDTPWKLSVSDNGIGKPSNGRVDQTKPGLGTSIVEALAKQLGARVEVSTTAGGRTVTVVHDLFASLSPRAEAHAA